MRRAKTPFKNANAKPTDPNAPEDRTPFLMSMTQLAKLIGRDQDTLTSWIKKHDCPVHTRGNGQGEATLLDPRDVFRWRESFCRKEEIAKFQPAANPSDPNGIPMPPKTTAEMIKLEQLKQQQIKTALSLEQVVLKSAAIQTYEAAVGILRTSVMGVPERLVREMAGFPEEDRLNWRLKAVAHCRSALKEAEKSIAKAMKGYKPGPVAVDPGMPADMLDEPSEDDPLVLDPEDPEADDEADDE